jgi:hypothetical protein
MAALGVKVVAGSSHDRIVGWLVTAGRRAAPAYSIIRISESSHDRSK